MTQCAVLLALGAFALGAQAQSQSWQPDLTVQQTYVLHRASSTDPKGANADFRHVAPGATETVLDADGPGEISHVWFTIADNEPYHLKRIVLRIYWDGEQNPSVEVSHRRLLRPRPRRISQLAIGDALRRQRQKPEQLLPHAFRASRTRHGYK